MNRMNTQQALELQLTRRQLFGVTAQGIGVAALATLLGPELLAASDLPPARSQATPS